MIVCDIRLLGSNSDKETQLGLLIIDQQNMSKDGKIADYRCRMYRKGTKLKKNTGKGWNFIRSPQMPFREGFVEGHRRLAEPVQNLVAKALKSMGYG